MLRMASYPHRPKSGHTTCYLNGTYHVLTTTSRPFVDSFGFRPYTASMEVHFTPEQEALLSKIASYAGTDVERLVKDAVLRLVEEDARFRQGVERGLAAAERGEFVEHKEVWANVEKILHS